MRVNASPCRSSRQQIGPDHSCCLEDETSSATCRPSGVPVFGLLFAHGAPRVLPRRPSRYKHFDWLYARLVERFPVISVPHLPEKQATGRFEEDFISKRRKGLIWWMNHMTSHPVLAHCDVFQHFLTCGTDEKAWKQGKRKAERDELVGANFFLTIR